MLGFLLTPWMKQWVIPAGGHCIGATEAWRLCDRFCWETQPQMMKNMTTSSTAPTSKLDQTPLKSMKKTSKKLIYSEWSALAPDYIGFFFRLISKSWIQDGAWPRATREDCGEHPRLCGWPRGAGTWEGTGEHVATSFFLGIWGIARQRGKRPCTACKWAKTNALMFRYHCSWIYIYI